MTTQRVLIYGLDLSIARTGWAIIRPGAERPIRHGVIPSASVSDASHEQTLDRMRRIIARIVQNLREEIEANPADVIVVAIEGPSYGSSGVPSYHARAGLFWLVMWQMQKLADAVVVIPPKSAKSYAASNGNADKAAMVAAVQRAYPGLYITDDNEADAVVLAAMVARELDLPQEVSTQRVNPAALNRVTWPDKMKRSNT